MKHAPRLPAALVAVLAFCASCSKNPAAGVSVNDAFRYGISPDVQTIVSIDLEKLKKTDLYHRHEQMLQLPQFDTFAQRAGIDPRRDVSALCLIWNGKHMVLLAHGDFPTAQLEAKLISNGAVRVPYKNFSLLQNGGDSVAFVDKEVAVASATPAVQAELDLLAERNSGVPEELKPRLAEIPSGAQIWEASRGGLPAANFPLRTDLSSILANFAANVTSTSLGLRFDAGCHLHARILCNSPEGAQRVNDALRGLIGLARLSTKDNELDLLRLWDAISVTKEQQAISIQADLPADLSDKFIDKLAEIRGSSVLRPQ